MDISVERAEAEEVTRAILSFTSFYNSTANASQPRFLRACRIAWTESPDKTNNPLVTFSYLAGGAANVVFRIRQEALGALTKSYQFVDISRLDTDITSVPFRELADKVLRVPRGYPEHLSGLEILTGLELIRSLFAPLGYIDTVALNDSDEYANIRVFKSSSYVLVAKHLVDHEGVFLPTQVMADLGKDLKPPLGPNLNARFAILLPNLASIPGKTLSLEFKPKWLLGSPNAPIEASRCRTCAMQFEQHSKTGAVYICPLRLVNGRRDDLKPWIEQRVEGLYEAEELSNGLPPQIEVVNSLLDFFTANSDGGNLLRYLRWLQLYLDRQGVLNPIRGDLSELWEWNLRLAMTFRDCSVFINIPYDQGSISGPITAKLGDLDLKSAIKIPDWARKERELIQKQYYTSTSGSSPRDDDPVQRCWLLDHTF